MPDKKLDQKQRDVFKKQLLKIKEDILHDIRNMNEVNSSEKHHNSTESAGHSTHMADVATDMYDREFNLGLASNDRELLQKVDTALKRIQDHSFGNCTKCHKSIPGARLKAIPYVETCLKCQEELEKSMR
ncbi:MAG: TraR/DksA family transcriptional regulator [Candidatus Omnitrophica bacterium]|nr:TraR/DksA family transcriptional regulator [Candidatus Omnitrophota bacterium]